MNAYNNLRNNECSFVKIGTLTSDADYKLNLKSFNLKKKVKQIILKEKLDLIHVQHNYPHYSKLLNLNLIQTLKLDIPFIVTLHEVQYPVQGLNSEVRINVLRHIEKNLIKNAAKIIVHTPAQRNFLETKYKTSNIKCIYHGLNFLKENQRNGKNILFFGMITSSKGVEYLIESMKELRDCNLIIAGNISKQNKGYGKKLLDTIQKNHLNNVKIDFRWIPEQEKWNYYRKADVVVLPYNWAPYQSGILHNAISCALPVIVTDVGALPEMVKEFKIGEIIKPRSSSDISTTIRKVLNNYNIYKNGIDMYRKEANWENIAIKHLNFFKEVLGIDKH